MPTVQGFAKSRNAPARAKGSQIVMERFDDTRHEFDVAGIEIVALAGQQLRALSENGFRAAALSGDRPIGSSDPQVERTLPHRKGG